MTDMSPDETQLGDNEKLQHGVTCGSCGARTFMYERYCHRCGADRWEGNT